MYTYHCENCDHEFDKYQSFSEDALTTCPNCQEEALYKVYKPALVLFKGSGFYVNDSKSHSPTLSPANNKDNHNDSHDHGHDGGDKPKNEKAETKKETPKKEASSKKSEEKK
jgi:putative FmdB family regulatory protein